MKITLEVFVSESKNLLKLSLPISISLLGSVLMGFVDNIMIGRVGYEYLAASSLANGIYYLIIIFGSGISYAVAPLVSIKLGEGKPEETPRILFCAIALGILISIALTLLIYFGADLIVYLNQEKVVEVEAIRYLKILSLGSVFFVLFYIMKQFVDGFKVTLPGMYITIAANFANAFLNYVLIYGKFGFPELKLEGAGWATNITRLLMTGAIVYYLVFKFSGIKIAKYKFFSSKNLTYLKKILKLGFGSSFQYFFEMGAFTIAGIMVGWLGARQLSAHQIVLNLATLTYMTVLGLSSASSIRVAHYYGEKNMSIARISGFCSVLLAIIFMSFSCLAFISFRNLIPAIYVDDEQTINIASNLLIIAGLFQIFDGAQAVGLGLLRGITEVKFPTFIAFFSYWVISLSTSYLLGIRLRWDVFGIWIGFLIGLAVSAISLNARFSIVTKNKY